MSNQENIMRAPIYDIECIAVDKVYDRMIKSLSEDTPRTISIPNSDDFIASLQAVVGSFTVYATIDLVGQPTPTIGTIQYDIQVEVTPGNTAKVSCVPINKKINITFKAKKDSDGTDVMSKATPANVAQYKTTQVFSEVVALCFPRGLNPNTDITVTLTDADSIITDQSGISLTATTGNSTVKAECYLCQDILVSKRVTLMLDGTVVNPRIDDIPICEQFDCPIIAVPASSPNVFPR